MRHTLAEMMIRLKLIRETRVQPRLKNAGAVCSFDVGDPYCFVFPVKRGLLEQVAPRMRDLADEPEILAK